MHQIFVQVPELVPVIFLDRVSDVLLFGDHVFGHDNWSWSWDELLKAFKNLLVECTRRYRIVIFIDGLDEFHGPPLELIKFVRNLTMPNVKVCASSRPWNEFQDAFDHGPYLRVERLTREDIKNFVSAELAICPAFADYGHTQIGFSARLTEDIRNKSDGVFLWVYLVTRSVTQGITNGERPSDLRKHLDSLPTDLEDPFSNILGSLDTWHSQRGSQIFQIHQATKLPLTLLDVSFADEDDINGAIQTSIELPNVRESNARAKLMNRHLNSCTKGLLDADIRTSRIPASAEVEWLHRTVKDFFQNERIWNPIVAKAPSTFDCNLSLSYCYIMRLKTQQVTTIQLGGLFDNVSQASKHADAISTRNSTTQKEIVELVDLTYEQLTTSIAPEMVVTLF